MSDHNVIIIGAGGHTRSLLNSISPEICVIGIFDDSYDIEKKEFINNIPILGKIKETPIDSKIILSIGDNRKRMNLFLIMFERMLKKNIIHRTAIIEPFVNIGSSNQILGNVYINSYTEVGDNNILNTGCIIEHESKIGSHCHISVNSTICGRSSIGDSCFIGSGAVVIDKVKICNNVIVGANSVVINNILEPGIYVGNPVKKIK